MDRGMERGGRGGREGEVGENERNAGMEEVKEGRNEKCGCGG